MSHEQEERTYARDLVSKTQGKLTEFLRQKPETGDVFAEKKLVSKRCGVFSKGKDGEFGIRWTTKARKHADAIEEAVNARFGPHSCETKKKDHGYEIRIEPDDAQRIQALFTQARAPISEEIAVKGLKRAFQSVNNFLQDQAHVYGRKYPQWKMLPDYSGVVKEQGRKGTEELRVKWAFKNPWVAKEFSVCLDDFFGTDKNKLFVPSIHELPHKKGFAVVLSANAALACANLIGMHQKLENGTLLPSLAEHLKESHVHGLRFEPALPCQGGLHVHAECDARKVNDYVKQINDRTNLVAYALTSDGRSGKRTLVCIDAAELLREWPQRAAEIKIPSRGGGGRLA